MQNNDKKVLLRISNLKQYFPLKGGRFVKANDGITLDIYEGETFGLVGESGCGKSTLGRTILQLYHQTYGRTMYYGRSLDDLAPKYVIDTVKNLKARRTKLRELEQKRDKLEADYAKLSEKEQYAKHGELDAARKLAEDALLDITKIAVQHGGKAAGTAGRCGRRGVREEGCRGSGQVRQGRPAAESAGKAEAVRRPDRRSACAA